jgi:hypothetical protein
MQDRKIGNRRCERCMDGLDGGSKLQAVVVGNSTGLGDLYPTHPRPLDPSLGETSCIQHLVRHTITQGLLQVRNTAVMHAQALQ